MIQDKLDARLSEEIKSFRKVWEGGYFEGDVLDPVGLSTYGPVGYISVLYALYLMCIRQYVTKESIVLEIGPGRGAFTKPIVELNPKEVWCLDAKSAEDNGFFQYVGEHANLKYIKVDDFSCSDLPDDHFNYLFSFGALCHVSFDGIKSYLNNLYPKLKPGAECFIMVADYNKFNRCMDNIEKLSIFSRLPFQKIQRLNWLLYKKRFRKWLKYRRQYPEGTEPEPGRWFHSGVNETCALLESLGYKVVSKDVGIVLRDPVIHFRKV